MVDEIKIAICDDEKMIRKELMRILREVLYEEQIRYEIYEFSSGMELLNKAKDIQLLFLDMDMPGIDGIDVGMKMLELNPKCKIVIASGREDRFKETYKVKPLRFISKPFDKEEIREAMIAYVGMTIGMDAIKVFKERKSYRIPQRDIQYVAAFNGYVEIFANGVLYRKDISMNQFEKLLIKDIFYKVHKSYIVNLFWVTEVNDKEVTLGNIKIPFSRRQRREFNDMYMRFDLKYR